MCAPPATKPAIINQAGETGKGKTRKVEESENELKTLHQQISSRLQAKTCGLPWAGTQFVGASSQQRPVL